MIEAINIICYYLNNINFYFCFYKTNSAKIIMKKAKVHLGSI